MGNQLRDFRSPRGAAGGGGGGWSGLTPGLGRGLGTLITFWAFYDASRTEIRLQDAGGHGRGDRCARSPARSRDRGGVEGQCSY